MNLILYACLAAAFCFQMTSADTCPPNSIWFDPVNRKNCLVVMEEPTTWEKANNLADDYGKLAILDNGFWNTLLANGLPTDTEFYIGYYCYKQNCFNVDDASPNYTNWATGQPETSDGFTCVTISRRDQKWRTSDCGTIRPWVARGNLDFSLDEVFNATFAEEIIWKLSVAVGWESDNDFKACATALGFKTDKIYFGEASCGPDPRTNDTCVFRGLSGLQENGMANVTFIFFRGTSNGQQLVDELVKANLVDFYSSISGQTRGQIDDYVYVALLRLWAKDLEEFYLANKNNKWVVAGWSLGGSLSTGFLAYLELSGLPIHLVHHITQGEPRTGDLAFSEFFRRRFPDSIRLVYGPDLVPHWPTHDIPEFGPPVPLYWHNSIEVWYNGIMAPMVTPFVCDDMEAPACSYSAHPLNLSFHDHYWGIWSNTLVCR